MDPENPIININIGLAYIHHALKRQAENRQHSILQGITFMLRYYECQKEALHIEERQEAHYNMARTYHLLGLVHLATPYYLKVLDEVEGDVSGSICEDLVIDTVYNLQTIYTVAGNLELVEIVSSKWLVI
jgi:general transcription factor 3C polypeptide 3 (transcription factor C subunit 4)